VLNLSCIFGETTLSRAALAEQALGEEQQAGSSAQTTKEKSCSGALLTQKTVPGFALKIREP